MSRLIESYKEADITKREGRVMTRGVGVGVALLILISVLLLCSSVALYIIKENEIEKRIFLERELSKTAKRTELLEDEVNKLKEVKTKIELELAVKDRELQNYREKFEMMTMERGLLEGERTKLAEKSTVVEEDFLRLKRDFAQLQQAKEVLEEKLKSLMDSKVRLKTIIVEPEPAGEKRPLEKTVEGEVLAVNKEYEFLVINLGAKNGLGMDSDISIYRSAELIAVARIEKLYENISAVVVNDKAQMERVKVGDTAIATVKEISGDENI